MASWLARWRTFRQTHRAWGWLADGAFVLLVLVGLTLWQNRGLVPAGERAPSFSLRDLEGKRWDSSALRGKKVVLHFWAPWCGVCQTETGTLNSLRASVGEDVQVLSVVLAYDDEAQVRRFVETQGVQYPVLLGTDALMRSFHVSAFPTTYFLSEDGTIRYRAVGYTTGAGFRTRLWFSSRTLIPSL